MFLGVAFLVRVGFCVGRVGTWLSVRGGLVLGQLKKNKARKKTPPNQTQPPNHPKHSCVSRRKKQMESVVVKFG